MRHSGDPRVVVTGIGVVSPFGVGRERYWQSISRGCSGTCTIADFDASEFACQVAAPVSGVTIDDVPPLEGDDIWDPEYRAKSANNGRVVPISVVDASGLALDVVPNPRVEIEAVR